jgi:hypothetical protein
MQEPSQEWSTLKALLLGRLLALPTNIRLGWRGLPGTNTPAYYDPSQITGSKSLKHWALSNGYSIITDVPLLTPLGYRTSQACGVLPVDGALPVRDQSGHVGRHQAPPGADVKIFFMAVIYEFK